MITNQLHDLHAMGAEVPHISKKRVELQTCSVLNLDQMLWLVLFENHRGAKAC